MSFLAEAVILGSRGMLGVDLAEALRSAGCQRLLLGDLPEVDVTRQGSLREFLAGSRPQVIFNCAALTDVDGCESQREAAFAVNAEGAGNVAAAAAEAGALIVHISTDYVFDGRKRTPYVEDDVPAPLSVYGQSKLDGERRVAERARDWLIVRTAWMYGRGRINFVDRIIRLARERDELVAVTDRIGSPTWTRDLAAALLHLVRCSARGIFHVVNEGGCSRYEQVNAILKFAGLNRRVRPADSSAFPRQADVPPYAVLSVAKLVRETNFSMRTWRAALEEYIRRESPAAHET